MREYYCKPKGRNPYLRRYTTKQWEAHKARQRARYHALTNEQKEERLKRQNELRRERGR